MLAGKSKAALKEAAGKKHGNFLGQSKALLCVQASESRLTD